VLEGDPYVSRRHCIIRPGGARLVVELCPEARNLLIVGEAEVSQAIFMERGSFVVGTTVVNAWNVDLIEEEPTHELPRKSKRADFVLVSSTRELVDRAGTLLARFSASEFVAFSTLARRYPDAADHRALGKAVWGDVGYDQYQLHRLLQRIRVRLGDVSSILENVRGAGYRLRQPVDVR
jgi:DNA-binding winged helix-turn-helix (wHTH) protein